MIVIQRERWKDCINQVMHLCNEAFELGEKQIVGLDLELDFDLYQQMDEADILHCLIMRKNGQPIGMHWVYVSATPRHKDKVMAQTDVIYVMPEHRRNSNDLISFSNDYIGKVADIWLISNRGYRDCSKLWHRKGFEEIETVMIKRI